MRLLARPAEAAREASVWRRLERERGTPLLAGADPFVEVTLGECHAFAWDCTFVAVVALTAGCASAKSFRSSTELVPPVQPDAVLVFFDAADIRVPYKVLGEILVEGSSGWGTDQNDLVKKAQKEAGKMGANAMLVQPTEKSSGSERIMAALFGTNDNKRRVTALRVEVQK